MEQKIFIPKSCEHTQALRVIVNPPSDKMYIQLCDPVTREPFQEGKIEGRRTEELAIFLFRPMKIIEDSEGNISRQIHLKAGDKVLVRVQIYQKEEKKEKDQIIDVL